MQGVNTIVDKAQNNTNRLLGVQNLSEQTLETWTKGITNIYNDAAKEYGLTIDMAGVVQAAQANAANDTGGVLNAVQMAEYRAMFGLTDSYSIYPTVQLAVGKLLWIRSRLYRSRFLSSERS